MKVKNDPSWLHSMGLRMYKHGLESKIASLKVFQSNASGNVTKSKTSSRNAWT